MKNALSSLFLFFIFFWNCSKKGELSSVPQIEFISWSRDSTNSQDHIVFSFTDKEGDIGQMANRSCQGNIVFERFRKTAIGYEPFPFYFPLCFRVDYISSEQEKATQGEIDVAIEHLYYYNDEESMDAFKLSIHLIDMAGHQSNTIETPDIEMP